jgi:hypothetical protein
LTKPCCAFTPQLSSHLHLVTLPSTMTMMVELFIVVVMVVAMVEKNEKLLKK